MDVAFAEFRHATELGTPRAASWDDEWLALVDETEARLERRICGAHAPDGEPCELGSTHANGRCRFHGGHPRIGGQPGNTNALVHGLYSRRLRQCNDTCPMWRTCPFAGADVMRLGPRKRPVCAYEAEAYAALTGLPGPTDGALLAISQETGQLPAPAVANAETEAGPATPGPVLGFENADAARAGLIYSIQCHGRMPRGQQIIHRVQREMSDGAASEKVEYAPGLAPAAANTPAPATRSRDRDVGAVIDDTGGILYAMLQRATLTLSTQSLTDQTEAEGAQYSLRTTKVSAAVTAFLRIARELRSWLRLRPQLAPQQAGASPEAQPKSPTNNWYDGYDAFFDVLDQAVEAIVRASGDPIAPVPDSGPGPVGAMITEP